MRADGAAALPPREEVFAREGLVAAAHPFVVEAGLEIMRAGGNAIDAMIASGAVMMCVDPCNGHLGADAFCIVHRADGSVHAFNGSGPAPSGATFDYYRERGGFPKDGLANATVPGVVALWAEASRRFGSKPLDAVLARAIAYARSGIPVTAQLRKTMLHESNEVLGVYPATAAIFWPSGGVPQVGDVMRQPSLARGLERIAKGGAEEFYRGSIAREMTEFSQANGGLFTFEDFAMHATEITPPLQVSYRGYTIFEEPPALPGAVLLIALNILERFDLRAYEPHSVPHLHLAIEAMKLAFEDKTLLGDGRFVDSRLEDLLSDAHADEQAARIDLHRARPSRLPERSIPGTDSAVFGDLQGNVVAYIHSTYHSCGLFAGETGVLLNGRMIGFSMDPASANVVAPRKRPMHTLNDYLVHDARGRVVLAGNTPGGNFQVQTNMQILTSILDYGMSLTEAIDAPRFKLGERRGVMQDPVVRIESRVAPEVIEGLRALGHRVEVLGPWDHDGAVQLIARDPQSGIYRGATESRRPGCSVGGF